LKLYSCKKPLEINEKINMGLHGQWSLEEIVATLSVLYEKFNSKSGEFMLI
jgi:hypothetical protein